MKVYKYGEAPPETPFLPYQCTSCYARFDVPIHRCTNCGVPFENYSELKKFDDFLDALRLVFVFLGYLVFGLFACFIAIFVPLSAWFNRPMVALSVGITLFAALAIAAFFAFLGHRSKKRHRSRSGKKEQVQLRSRPNILMLPPGVKWKSSTSTCCGAEFPSHKSWCREASAQAGRYKEWASSFAQTANKSTDDDPKPSE